MLKTSKYFETTGSLRFCSKHEPTDFNTYVANTNNFKCFKYKSRMPGNTVAKPTLITTNRILKKRQWLRH